MAFVAATITCWKDFSHLSRRFVTCTKEWKNENSLHCEVGLRIYVNLRHSCDDDEKKLNNCWCSFWHLILLHLNDSRWAFMQTKPEVRRKLLSWFSCFPQFSFTKAEKSYIKIREFRSRWGEKKICESRQLKLLPEAHKNNNEAVKNSGMFTGISFEKWGKTRKNCFDDRTKTPRNKSKNSFLPTQLKRDNARELLSYSFPPKTSFLCFRKFDELYSMQLRIISIIKVWKLSMNFSKQKNFFRKFDNLFQLK